MSEKSAKPEPVRTPGALKELWRDWKARRGGPSEEAASGFILLPGHGAAALGLRNLACHDSIAGQRDWFALAPTDAPVD